MATGVERRDSTAGPAGAAVPRLANLAGGEWRVPDGEWLGDVDPASGETVALVPLSGPAEVEAAVAAARAALPGWRAVPPQRRARALMRLREELLRRRDELAASSPPTWARPLPTPMARSARDRVGRGRRRRSRTCSRARTLEGVADGRRRRDGAPAGRRRRRDHALQLPGDDPALVPALCDRLRQHLRPEALGARPARRESDRRAGRRDRRDPARCRQPGPRRPRRRRGVARPRRGRRDLLCRPGRDGSLSPAARPRAASGCRRWAGPRTRWS